MSPLSPGQKCCLTGLTLTKHPCKQPHLCIGAAAGSEISTDLVIDALAVRTDFIRVSSKSR